MTILPVKLQQAPCPALARLLLAERAAPKTPQMVLAPSPCALLPSVVPAVPWMVAQAFEGAAQLRQRLPSHPTPCNRQMRIDQCTAPKQKHSSQQDFSPGSCLLLSLLLLCCCLCQHLLLLCGLQLGCLLLSCSKRLFGLGWLWHRRNNLQSMQAFRTLGDLHTGSPRSSTPS